ncbi:hypothetical protein [Bdellovibrio bacteriovorus]|uniref:Uncharacterized protein n=1 Tax=Bdellovibrio bacteriovorus TaxID=959 RepID=A0A1Z3N5S5_BDEBC|nr:hypothetical protein [Bdellovibrio bacteriovorus]ASD62824.1 hypothetical protein B9G79_04200 [Bdellovibrio bacteriovorus]
MKTKVTGSTIEISIEGPISEKASLFEASIQAYKEIKLNLSKVTFINSIGVKNWILWTCRIPQDATLYLEECPFVIVNQINIVQGFVPKNSFVTSFMAPFLCEKCSHEQIVKLSKDVHYFYTNDQSPYKIQIPEDMKCAKCGGTMEADFIMDKTFSFLKNS